MEKVLWKSLVSFLALVFLYIASYPYVVHGPVEGRWTRIDESNFVKDEPTESTIFGDLLMPDYHAIPFISEERIRTFYHPAFLFDARFVRKHFWQPSKWRSHMHVETLPKEMFLKPHSDNGFDFGFDFGTTGVNF